MKLNFSNFFLVIAILFSSFSFGQMSDNEKLEESYYLINERLFLEALPLLKEQYEKDKTNANINFNLGVAILNSNDTESKKHALPYLKVASENASPKYKPFNIREKRAPVEAWYYLGMAQHSQHQFDEAKTSFRKFEEYISEKHFLWDEIEQRIRMAEYAQLAVLKPVNIESKNLGDKLNGFYPDFSPVVRIDESALYFTSRRLRKDSSNYNIFDPNDGMMFEDIYVSFNDEDGWSEPIPLNINTDDHEATINLSVDGHTLYIYKDENGNGELLYSELEDDSAGIETWSQPKKFGSDINTEAYETHVTITPDQKTLYFISDREGGLGGKDIYFCRRLPTGGWALAQNVGPILNTKYDEDGVFMHPDGQTLYFSSNGHTSMGGYDIMYSVLTDSGWTTPKNMGYPINSVDDDAFFVTTPDGKRAYYSSFKGDGYGEKDVYVIQLLDAEESSLTLYRGEFTFVDRFVPPKGAQVTITNNTTGEYIGTYTPRQRDGQFSAILAANYEYHFTYEADEYETYEEDIYVPAGASYQEIYKDIKLKPVRVSKGITKMTPALVQKADVNGALVKFGKPLANRRIVLLDEGGNLFQETETDITGQFNFKDLDPSKSYMVKVYSNEKDIVYNYEINATNDQGEKINTKELNDTTHIFVPSAYPYEFYGIRAKAIAGRVRDADEAVAGLNVRLINEEGDMIGQEETDKFGEFNFTKLDLDQTYRIVFEGDFPDDPTILITDDLGRIMTFRKVRDGVYEYVPDENVGTKFIGVAKRNGTALSGVLVSLKDGDGNQIDQKTTDGSGNFVFENLSLDREYIIEFGDDFPDDATLIVTNEFGQELVFHKKSQGVYEYYPGARMKLSDIKGSITSLDKPVKDLQVLLLDRNKNLLSKAKTDEVGKFNFYRLNLNAPYFIVFEGNYPDDIKLVISNDDFELLLFKRLKRGLYKYEPTFNIKIVNNNNEILSEETIDEKAQFNFAKLDPDQSYTIVMDSDFPDDIIVFTNEDGIDLIFRRTSAGVYEYHPGAKKKLHDIEGLITSLDKPVRDLQVHLTDRNKSILKSTKTDSIGKFNFYQINLSLPYYIIFEGDYPDDVKMVISNDELDLVLFRKLERGLYKYEPTFKVKIINRGNEVLSEETINQDAEFDFAQLDVNEYYMIIMDKDFPDDVIIITNQNGEDLVFRKTSPGVYEYVPANQTRESTQIVGRAKRGGTALTGLKVSLLDGGNNLLQQATSDATGEFNFNNLDLNQYYLIKFEGDFPEDAILYFTDEFGQKLAFNRKAPGVYEYIPGGAAPKLGTEILASIKQGGKPYGGFGVEIQNSKNVTIDQTEVDKTGEFAFKKLNLDNRYRIVFDESIPDDAEIVFKNEFGQILKFMKVKDGIYEYVPRPAQYPFKSYTIGVAGNPDFKDTYPKPGELQGVISYYQKYFPYNAKDINESNKEFVQFIDDIAELVSQRGYADIIITSSASKVPTKTWKSNSILTKRRANDSKRLLEKMFKSKGLKEDQYNFIDINTLITGPEYKYDHIKNRSTYEKHQYVRIFIK